MKKQKVIKSDVFDICKRIKELDESYFIIYNFEKNRFEVHSNAQRGTSFCFVIPYDQLDARTIEHARKTNISRKDKLIEEIDRENDKRFENIKKDTLNHLREVLE